MNRYYKEKKPFQGTSSGLKGRTPQLLPTPGNAMSYQQLIPTAFHDNSIRNGSQNASTGRNRGYAPSAKRVLAGNSGQRWPQENVAFSGGNSSFNTTDDNVWEDMDFDFDDPSVMTQNQEFFKTNHYDTFEKKTTFQDNSGSMMAGRSGHPYQRSSKRTPFSEAGPSQNYYGPPTGQGYNTYEATNVYHPFVVSRPVNNPAIKNDRGIQMPKILEKIEEDPVETLTRAHLDNAQSKMDEANFPRVYTVSVTKLKSWAKYKYDVNGEMIFEVFGILDLVKSDVPPGVKVFVLKEQQKSKITCIFYEIDRKLELGNIGHWQRCVGLLKNNEFQCLSLRAATQEELQSFDATLSANSRALAKLLRSFNG